MKKLELRSVWLSLVSCLLSVYVFAQPSDTTKLKKDSTPVDYVTRMQAFAKHAAQESLDDFNADKATLAQKKAFDDIKKTFRKLRSIYSTGLIPQPLSSN